MSDAAEPPASEPPPSAAEPNPAPTAPAATEPNPAPEPAAAESTVVQVDEDEHVDADEKPAAAPSAAPAVENNKPKPAADKSSKPTSADPFAGLEQALSGAMAGLATAASALVGAKGELEALFLVLAASLVVMGSAANACKDNSSCSDRRWAWAVAVGTVGAALTLLRLLLARFARVFMMLPVMRTADKVLAVALVILWSFGVGFNTEYGAGLYRSVGNGFFASWAAFVGSVWFAGHAFRGNSVLSLATSLFGGAGGGNGNNANLSITLSVGFAAALVELAQAADVCRHDACTSRVAYGVALGVIAAVLTFVLLLVNAGKLQASADGQLVLSLLLLVWWAIGAGVTTDVDDGFFNPFTSANGYFATWAALCAALAHFVLQWLALPSTILAALAGPAGSVVSAMTSLMTSMTRGQPTAYFVCLVASLVEFGSVADACNGGCPTDRSRWAVAVGVVSFLLCLVRVVLMIPPSLQGQFPPAVDRVFAVLLVLWWSLGVGFITEFDNGAAFTGVGNAFFAGWIALASATWLVGFSFQTPTPSFALVFGASLVELAQAADLCRHGVTCTQYAAYAVAVGVVSAVVTLLAWFQHRRNAVTPALHKFLALFLLVWWAVGAGINTSSGGVFTDPFEAANGYFATWVAFLGAVFHFARFWLA